MKSIRYLLFREPCKLDDCIDMVLEKKEIPRAVSLDLKTRDRCTEEYIITQLIGEYTWEFPERTVKFQTIYGGVMYLSSEKEREKTIKNSNLRLWSDKGKIEFLEIELKGKEDYFNNFSAHPYRILK